jgi:hypothetical protein
MTKLLTACWAAAHIISAQAVTLINVDYTAHLNPNLSMKTGPAVVGNSPTDYWNIYSRDVSSQWDWRTDGVVENLKYSDGSNSGANLAVFNAPGAWYTVNPDPMYDSYLYPFNSNPIVSEFTNLPPGTYDLYVYAHGQPSTENAILSLWNGATSYGDKSTSANPAADEPGWTEGFEYVLFQNIIIGPGDKLTLISSRDQSGIAVLNGLQLAAVPEGGATAFAAVVMIALCGSSQRTKKLS